jgi:hypothetical protein
MTVGADADNGKYAMLGARTGCYQTAIVGADHLAVRDLTSMEKTYLEFIENSDIEQELRAYGESLRQRLDIPVADYDEDDSRFFRFVMPPHNNKGVQDREHQ